MKKPIIGLTIMAAALTAGIGLNAKDPVVMTVNGEDVPLSEFEYLYKKNRQQQATLQPIGEYAEIFKIYKLKVADAKAMGIDTTEAFKREYAQYRNELAQPYLADSAFLKSIVDEEFARMPQEVETYHIMRFKTKDAATNRASKQLLDSIYNELLNGGDFAELAEKYSQDKGSNSNGGFVGWVRPLRYPYLFEEVVYSLKPGEISKVFDSGSVYHIVKVGNRRTAEGRLSASHIMKMVPKDAPKEMQRAAKLKIDSIYALILEDPMQFERLCVLESDDNSNSKKGGILQPFYRGEMVTEFADKAFSMADGEISEPIRTDYGWHIIKRFSMKPGENYDEIKGKVLQSLRNPGDRRSSKVRDHQLFTFAKEFKLKPNTKKVKEIEAYIAANGIDSLFHATYFNSPQSSTPLYTFKGEGSPITIGDLESAFKGFTTPDPAEGAEEWKKRTDAAVRAKLLIAKENSLERTEPEYRNLLHEFRDGSLLYEAGRTKVWDKASLDTAGLEAYFKAHCDEYTWKEPRAKGFLLQVANDSVEQAVRARLKELTPAEYIPTIRKEFPTDVQIDRVLASQGVNALVDYCAFGGAEARPSNSKFNNFFLYDYRIIDKPEEVADVRGLVTSDYQNVLENEWVEEIKELYPVVIYTKVLDKVK